MRRHYAASGGNAASVAKAASGNVAFYAASGGHAASRVDAAPGNAAASGGNVASETAASLGGVRGERSVRGECGVRRVHGHSVTDIYRMRRQ